MSNKRAIKRGEKGENIVANLLTNDTSFHRLINNLVLLGNNGVSHQIDHILIKETGIFVIETKNYYGQIKGQEDDLYWSKEYLLKGKSINEKVHNPLKQNQSHIRAVKRIIGNSYPIYGFVTFIQNNVNQLNIFNVCNIDSLLSRLSYITIDKPLKSEEIESIYQKLLESEAYINDEGHLSNIKKIKKERREYQKSMRTAIENRICPDCQNKLIMIDKYLKCPHCQKIIKL